MGQLGLTKEIKLLGCVCVCVYVCVYKELVHVILWGLVSLNCGDRKLRQDFSVTVLQQNCSFSRTLGFCS